MTLETILRNTERKIFEHCQRLLAQEDLPVDLAERLRRILSALDTAV